MLKFIVPSASTGFLAISFSPAEITNLTGAIGILVAAIFVGVVNVIAARSAARGVIAPVAAKVDKIEDHVNNDKTRTEGVILMQKQQIDLQRETIDELKKAAALLAQAKATTDLSHLIVSAVVPLPSTPAQVEIMNTPLPTTSVPGA